MISRFILLITVFIFLFGCTSDDLTPKRDKTFYLKGTVLGYDGKPLELAHIHVKITGKKSFEQSNQTDKNGNFNVPLKSADLISLQFTGVNHFLYNLEIFNPGFDEDIELEVRLKPYQLKSVLTNVKVIGNFNNYSFADNLVEMNKNDADSFTAVVPNKSDTLFYQILGALEEERSINGTQYGGLVYDGGGDYRSYIVTKDSLVTINFEPEKMSFPDIEPSVISKNNNLKRYFKVMKEIASLANSAITEYRKNPDLKKFYSFMNTNISKLWKNEKDLRTKLLLEKNYMFYTSGIDKPNQPLLENFFKTIGEKSSLWKTQYQYYIPALISLKNVEYRKKYIRYLTEDYHSKITREVILYYLIRQYFGKKNEKEGMKYYKILMKKFPNSPTAKLAKKEYSTDKKIAINKIVPDFSIENLDKPGTVITSKDLRGKYILIDLWATWCGPCVGEMENLHKVFERFKNMNFSILSISIDKKKEDVAKFRAGKWKMPWLHSFSEGVWKSKMVEFFETSHVPMPMLIGPDGKILEMEGSLRGAELEKTLDKYL